MEQQLNRVKKKWRCRSERENEEMMREEQEAMRDKCVTERLQYPLPINQYISSHQLQRWRQHQFDLPLCTNEIWMNKWMMA